MHGVNVRFAREGEFPFVVSITNMNRNNQRPEANHVCTGTLVSKRDVVTTDHCVLGFLYHVIEIIVGSHDIRQGTRYFVLWWLSFNQFSTIQRSIPVYEHNDIMMIRLNQTIQENIVPPSISFATNKVLFRSKLQTAGFGITNNDQRSNFMETAELQILTTPQCEQRLSELLNCPYKLNDNKFCAAADPYVILDKGNSGSPMLLKGKLVGIHRGSSPGNVENYHPRKVNIFINALYYRRFIEVVIKNY
ncbi:PREDICTED: chymotrypsin-2-like [Ceratosolen solmsi marchali]|uniref:Chymotrypsin-2-like n=1 Tax=Ceratosolen solmsi marchali TaxID=326594 RepID=A0AAJ6YCB2_9HYME|nr:PREDICTED: chymotrypsin-2-like [Ceratosolen solmsi marchali]